MSYSFNSTVLVGRLTREPELRVFSENFCRTSFHLAVNRGGKKDEADFIPVALYGEVAKVAEKILKKGTPVLVYGRIKVRSYEKDNQTKWITEVVGRNFQILEKIQSDHTDLLQDDDCVPDDVNQAIVDAQLNERVTVPEMVTV